MQLARAVGGSLVGGVAAALVAVAYRLETDVVPVVDVPEIPNGELFVEATGIPLADLLVAATLVVVPFAVAAGATYVAFRHRIVVPILLVIGFGAAPAVHESTADQVLVDQLNADLVLVGLLVVGPLVVVAGLAELLFRARIGRLANAPTARSYQAMSIGVILALLYVGVFAIRAVLPLWRFEPFAPGALPPTEDLVVSLWYLLAVSLVLVGLPVALNRRFGLVAPLVGLAAYLLVDIAYVQPAVAESSALVAVLMLAVWPMLAALLAGVASIEWWYRNRRGEYEPDDEGQDEGSGGFTVEGGLIGDRMKE